MMSTQAPAPPVAGSVPRTAARRRCGPHSHRRRPRFSSQTRDGRYCRARYYHPGLQRFINEDPLKSAGGDFNFYRYADDNPLRFTDPLGTFNKTQLIGGLIDVTLGSVTLSAAAGAGGTVAPVLGTLVAAQLISSGVVDVITSFTGGEAPPITPVALAVLVATGDVKLASKIQALASLGKLPKNSVEIFKILQQTGRLTAEQLKNLIEAIKSIGDVLKESALGTGTAEAAEPLILRPEGSGRK